MLIAYLSTLRIRGPPQYQAYVLAVAYKAQHDLASVSSLTSFPIALYSTTLVYLLFLESTRHKARSHFTLLHWMLLLLRSLCSVATFSMRLTLTIIYNAIAAHPPSLATHTFFSPIALIICILI